jgi:hypothetical protein
MYLFIAAFLSLHIDGSFLVPSYRTESLKQPTYILPRVSHYYCYKKLGEVSVDKNFQDEKFMDEQTCTERLRSRRGSI